MQIQEVMSLPLLVFSQFSLFVCSLHPVISISYNLCITFFLFYHDVLVSCLVILSIRNVVSMSEIIDLPMYQWLLAAGWSPTTPITTTCYSYYYSTTILSSTPLYSSPLLSSFCYFYYYSTTSLILLFTTSTSVFYQLLVLLSTNSTTSLLLLSTISDCPICLLGSEDIKHMMFMWDRAKSVWQLLLFWEAAPAFFCQISPLLYFCHIFYPLCLGSSSCFFYTFSSLCLLSSCCFFAKSPLSSPLLCFADDEIVQVHTLYGI